MRIDKVGMRCPEIAGELVQCILANESAGRHAQQTIFGVKFLNRCSSARRITFTKDFRKIALEQRLDATRISAHRRRRSFFACVLAHREMTFMCALDAMKRATANARTLRRVVRKGDRGGRSVEKLSGASYP
jgi:hypothetical protein